MKPIYSAYVSTGMNLVTRLREFKKAILFACFSVYLLFASFDY